MKDSRMFVVCRQYRAELKRLRERSSCVTAGQVAVALGVSRATAKKHLEMCVRLGYAQTYDFTHVNGMTCTAYINSVSMP